MVIIPEYCPVPTYIVLMTNVPVEFVPRGTMLSDLGRRGTQAWPMETWTSQKDEEPTSLWFGPTNWS